jgi:hypothetical protein
MRYPKVKVRPIAWERYEAKRGRAFEEDERRFVVFAGTITELLRSIVHIREKFILGYLESQDPKALRRLAKSAVDRAEIVRTMMAFECMDPEMWRHMEGDRR